MGKRQLIFQVVEPVYLPVLQTTSALLYGTPARTHLVQKLQITVFFLILSRNLSSISEVMPTHQ